jgi:hypothetical protein
MAGRPVMLTVDAWDDLYHRLVAAGFAEDDAQDIVSIVAKWGADRD